MNTERLVEIQNKMLQKIIEYSFTSVPFYKDIWKDVVNKKAIKSSKIIDLLPIICRKDIFLNKNNMISKHFDKGKLICRKTSGTLGRTLKIFYDIPSIEYFNAELLRDFLDKGYRTWEKIVFFSPDKFKKKGIFEVIEFTRGYFIPEFWSDEVKIKKIENINPQIVVGDLSTIINICFSNHEPEVKPRFITVYGDLLTESVRKFLEEVFNTTIYQRYSSAEILSMAWECKEKNMHYNIDIAYLEFLKNKLGYNVIATNFINRAMPLIRYDLGDIVIPSDDICSCGRGLPLIKSIEGRANDFIVLPNGKILSPKKVQRYLESLIGSGKEFRIVQKTKYNIVLYLKNCLDEPFLQIMENKMKKLFGNFVNVKIILKNKFPKNIKMMKYRTVTSKVKINL